MTKPILITGGVGFIGTNVAARLLAMGQHVIVLDNLSRTGVGQNLRWLSSRHPKLLQVEIGDVRDAKALARVVPQVEAVFHFAAQTAVTSSLVEPRFDFDVNAGGTLQVLEAVRKCETQPKVLFTSTNKVYGGLSDVPLERIDRHYQPVDASVRERGVSETRPLDFHTPYGCSKGTADQYVLDYARVFEVPAAVFRMSCIYGPHQCGTEDQGWVAHFALRALANEVIHIYGDGYQVRDLLYVEDLVDAMLLAMERMHDIAGQAFNIGGGPSNTASVLDVIDVIRALNGHCEVDFHDWRPSDQRYYVSDTRRFQAATGWRPRMNVSRGISAMFEWLKAAAKASQGNERHERHERAARDRELAVK